LASRHSGRLLCVQSFHHFIMRPTAEKGVRCFTSDLHFAKWNFGNCLSARCAVYFCEYIWVDGVLWHPVVLCLFPEEMIIEIPHGHLCQFLSSNGDTPAFVPQVLVPSGICVNYLVPLNFDERVAYFIELSPEVHYTSCLSSLCPLTQSKVHVKGEALSLLQMSGRRSRPVRGESTIGKVGLPDRLLTLAACMGSHF
jgi:hypothetical protein